VRRPRIGESSTEPIELVHPARSEAMKRTPADLVGELVERGCFARDGHLALDVVTHLASGRVRA